MGYFYSYATRSEMIRDLTTEAECWKRINTRLWLVMRHEGTAYIVLFHLSRAGGLHGYKDFCERMHPYYYDCPLEYLDLAPETNADWRRCVRAYHRGEHPNMGQPAL